MRTMNPCSVISGVERADQAQFVDGRRRAKRSRPKSRACWAGSAGAAPCPQSQREIPDTQVLADVEGVEKPPAHGVGHDRQETGQPRGVLGGGQPAPGVGTASASIGVARPRAGSATPLPVGSGLVIGSAQASRCPHRGGELMPSIEDYVKTVYKLGESGGPAVTTTALAGQLAVTASSASGMVRKLGELGLVVHARYRQVTLTAAGERVALDVVGGAGDGALEGGGSRSPRRCLVPPTCAGRRRAGRSGAGRPATGSDPVRCAAGAVQCRAGGGRWSSWVLQTPGSVGPVRPRKGGTGYRFLARARNSARVRASSRSCPYRAEVTVREPDARIPRSVMHWCSASSTTPTPRGRSCSCSQLAT